MVDSEEGVLRVPYDVHLRLRSRRKKEEGRVRYPGMIPSFGAVPLSPTPSESRYRPWDPDSM